MKFLFTFFLTLASLTSYSQKDYKYPFENWEPKDFRHYNLEKVEAYSYKAKRNGKLNDKSVLLSRYIIDTLNNSVYGVYTVHTISSHGPETWQLYNFTNIYDKKGKIVHTEEYPLLANQIKKRNIIDIDFRQSQTNYNYDTLGNLIKKINLYTTYKYALFKEDTLSKNISSSPVTTEYVYKNNQQIIEYFSKDSTTTKFISVGIADTDSKAGYSYEARYKNKEWFYNKLGDKALCRSYTRQGKLHTTYNYCYDAKHRIIKEIDSTGWYINGKSYLKKLITYEYGSDGKKVQTLNYDHFSGSITDREEEKYDQNERLISKFTYNQYYSMGTEYTYEGQRLIQKTDLYNNKNTSKTSFTYNDRNLIIEIRKYYKNKLEEVIKYYYE